MMLSHRVDIILRAPCYTRILIPKHGGNTTAHPTTTPTAEPSRGWGARAASSLSVPCDAE